ncbi:MAG: hypothetical protein ACRDQ5_00035 [Sciscionella sp.]
MAPGGGAELEGMARGFSDLKSAISCGGVTFTEESANALKSAMQELQTTLREVHANASRLGNEPPIGDTPAARVYKPFLATIATDPVQGLVPQLQKMQHEADDIIAAIDKSAKSTQASDEDGAAGMPGIPS